MQKKVDSINGVNFIDKSGSFLTCSSVQLYLYITCLGAVQPYSLYNRSIGNIHFTSIKEIWDRPIFYKMANYTLNDSKNCSICVIVSYCTQCPGIALSETGSSRDCSRYVNNSISKEYRICYHILKLLDGISSLIFFLV